VLQVGLVLDGRVSPAWIKALIARVRDSEHVAVRHVFLTGKTRRASSLFSMLYGAIDRALFPLKTAALAPASLTAMLADISAVEIRTAEDWADSASALTQLDVLLDLSSGELPGAPPSPCALWHFSTPMRQGLAGLAEVVQRRDVTCAELFAVSGTNTYCIYRSYSGTHNLSARRNRQRLFWKAHTFVAQRLEQLAENGPVRFYKRYAVAADPSPPNHSHLWRYLPSFKWHWWLSALGDLFYRNTWHVHCGPSAEYPESFAGFSAVCPTPGTYWADPFVVEHDGERLLFVEEFDLKKKKGHIAVAPLHTNGTVAAATTVIDEPHHLSYPFVFAYENEIYMLPESSDNSTIDLYRSTDFPRSWQRTTTLMRDVYAVDSTLFFYRGRWWLFTCLSSHSEAPARDELFLYYADSPLDTKWTPHPLNPIVSDARCARPAGRIFLDGGRIYRPAQDCSRRYGYGLRLMEVVKLNEEEYEECEYKAYLPEGKRVGIHTFNTEAGWAVIDVKLKARRWP